MLLKLGIKTKNERIRGTAKAGEISKKVQESRLKWYRHAFRRGDYVNKSCWRGRGK